MPLHVTVSPKSVTATLHYLVRGAEKPVRYAYDLPEGSAAYNGLNDPREVRIEDARGREGEFTLDRNGFALMHSKMTAEARLSFHTSFENPLAQGAPPRESIEVRTLVFF